MKYWVSYFITVVMLSILFSLIYYIFNPYKLKIAASPIPDFLMVNNNKQVTLLDFWSPLLDTFASGDGIPEINAKSVLMYDLANDKVIYSKNSKEKRPMASLTKIMTAIIALEDPDMPEEYYVRGVDLVGEDSMGLSAGEILTKTELLYGLLLNSGNDASEVFAHEYPAGREAFLRAMQDKATALGLKDTYFSNPSGLQGDGTQYTTAEDLLVVTRYALDNFPLFRQIVATYEYHIPASLQHKEYNLVNETNLISTYPGVKGVKTGYTPEAGMCLVTYYEKDGIRLLGVLLDSPNRRGEMRDLLDYSLKTLGITPPEHDT